MDNIANCHEGNDRDVDTKEGDKKRKRERVEREGGRKT